MGAWGGGWGRGEGRDRAMSGLARRLWERWRGERKGVEGEEAGRGVAGGVVDGYGRRCAEWASTVPRGKETVANPWCLARRARVRRGLKGVETVEEGDRRGIADAIRLLLFPSCPLPLRLRRVLEVGEGVRGREARPPKQPRDAARAEMNKQHGVGAWWGGWRG